ncbi:TPA: hypothetical protein N0F65_003207 [Lagenidium giganteum]|uniref:Acid phosphatase n=1 Tax=Lagenidium giganteum TaxID=4803 RepID=A0AAV2ZC24_9STRA|nr:TPA: hypothetical protein N0F65_003207 [Lagenidium giganteum]
MIRPSQNPIHHQQLKMVSTVSFLRSVGLAATLVLASASAQSLRAACGDSTPAQAQGGAPNGGAAAGNPAQQQQGGATAGGAAAGGASGSPDKCSPVPAAPANWFIAAEAPDYNNKKISELLASVPSIRKKGEAYSVFDWDNTCTYGDISYTSVYYQMDNLEYRIPADKFEETNNVYLLQGQDKEMGTWIPSGFTTKDGKKFASSAEANNACAAYNPVPAAPANWYIAAEAPDYNNKKIGELLASLPTIRGKGEAYAVFDWDNTCTFGDITYTSVFYQMDNLDYHIPADKFEETNNVYLLQGQDKEMGTWIPSGFTTKDGKKFASAVESNNQCAAYKFIQA